MSSVAAAHGWWKVKRPVPGVKPHPHEASPIRTSRIVRIALVYSLTTAAYLIARHFLAGGDYVGNDNDDVMRLMEVRDLMAGQNWFDMHQYRLGLDGGTLMHWSRFVDLPIAALISFFSLFLHREPAEAAALVVWPSLTIVPLFIGMGLSGFRLAGRTGTHIAIALTALYIIAINRFAPGDIDHHNVQMALMAILAAMLIDNGYRPRSFALAGVMAGIAIAIGAETTPHVGAACALVALLWAWRGECMARAAQAFGLALAATLAFAFYATTPPHLYSVVRCDQLSVGFYVLGTIGGGFLFFSAAATISRRSRLSRFAALAVIAAATATVTALIMPQCMRGPYASLDPLLIRIWLDHVSETQSVISTFAAKPFTAGSFYAVPVIGIGVCAWRILRDERRETYLIVLALLTVATAVTAFEIRGALFASIFAFLPLCALIADLRQRAAANTRSVKLALAFIIATLCSVPLVWAIGGSLTQLSVKGEAPADAAANAQSCKTRTAMTPLAEQPLGVVAGPSNTGVAVLRYTGQRVLAAPYHRDPGGMLAALHIELASPQKAEAYIRRSGTTIFAYCPSDPETSTIEHAAPNGLLSALARGDVPDYLKPVAGTANAPVRLFRVVPAGN